MIKTQDQANSINQTLDLKMSAIPASISNTAASLLKFSPTAWIKSWLMYVGIQTHVRGTIDPELKPLHNVCEYLNALHIYADEARQGKVRSVESYHFCSHVRKDLRQCLIYDSCTPGARLIGVEYMIPKEKYETLPPEEQKLWHSHEFEVQSGMLILPTPESHGGYSDKWEKLETQAMTEVVGLYGKTFHTWQVDRGDEIPLGLPKLMGSLTEYKQLDIDEALKGRNERFQVDHRAKKEVRKDIEGPGVHRNADSWWKEAQEKRVGVYE